MQGLGEPNGLRLKYLRKKKGLRLADVARHIGRSVGFVSQIERGLSRPGVEDISALAQLLGVDYRSFFQPAAAPAAPHLVRPESRAVLDYRGGITDQLLSPTLSGRFHMLLTEIQPGAGSGQQDLQEDEGEQGGLVLEGALDLWLDGQKMRLGPGDSFHFASTLPHRYQNPGPGVTRICWCVSLR